MRPTTDDMTSEIHWNLVAAGGSKAQSWHRSSRRRIIVLVALFSIGVCGWFAREPLLRGAASSWVISDPLTRADAIVVLGGNFHVRPRIAAGLYEKGFANKILISQTGEREVPVMGPSDAELNRAALLKLGVPSGAIETFGSGNASTRDEAIAIRQWAQRNRASVFIIPSETLSARRVQWIFRRELSGSGIQVEVPSFEPPGFSHQEWWKTEQGPRAFYNESSNTSITA